jgi:hypothetical protein
VKGIRELMAEKAFRIEAQLGKDGRVYKADCYFLILCCVSFPLLPFFKSN